MAHPKKVMFWDDERSVGNGIIVNLAYGWEFGDDKWHPTHVRGFDSKREALDAVRESIPCHCKDCNYKLNRQ
jgi:hypothetical protein